MLEDIWKNLSTLRDKLLYEERIDVLYKSCHVSGPLLNTDEQLSLEVPDFMGNEKSEKPSIKSRDEILKTIEEKILGILQSLADGVAPSYVYSNLSNWDNVSVTTSQGLQLKEGSAVTTVKLDSIQSVKKFALITKVLSMIYKAVQSDRYCTKRDMFYQDPVLFGSQAAVDNTVDVISCMLRIPRWELHVLATSKGMLAGDLQFRDQDGNFIDCSQTDTGVLVPNHVCGIQDMQTSARFILVIEKDATFQKLVDCGFCQKMFPCILVTGKGFPDVNTRLMLRKLWDNFQIPTLALVDADPHGMEIVSVYKFGSRSMSYEAPNLTLPSLKWLGILPSDIQRLRIGEQVLMPMTKSDVDKAYSLLKRDYFTAQHHWKGEVELLLRTGKKAEIQALEDISPHYLNEVFIPAKLKSSGWL